MKLNKKNIVITGAASGIGQAILKNLNDIFDCRITAVDLNTDNIKESDSIFPFQCDLSKPENIDELFDFAISKMGSIDIFIANAGFAYYEKIDIPDWNHIQNIFKINTFSPIYAAEKMKSIQGDKPFNVVATASAIAFLPIAGYALYASSKAALNAFATAYRHELTKNQKLQLIYPIATKTDFFKTAGDGPVPWPSQTADEVALKVIDGILKDKETIIPSRIYYSLRILDRFIPIVMRAAAFIEAYKFKKWLKQ